VILESQLNAMNKITTIGALAIRISKSGFCVINWTSEEMQILEGKSRKI
jgi:hypothetical protein